MSIGFLQNIELKNNVPLDSRQYYATMAEAVTASVNGETYSTFYDGLIAYVKEYNVLFMWNSDNTNMVTFGKWRAITDDERDYIFTASDLASSDSVYTYTKTDVNFFKATNNVAVYDNYLFDLKVSIINTPIESYEVDRTNGTLTITMKKALSASDATEDVLWVKVAYKFSPDYIEAS